MPLPKTVEFTESSKYPKNDQNQTPDYFVSFQQPSARRRGGKPFGKNRAKAISFFLACEKLGWSPTAEVSYYAFTLGL